MPPNTRATRAAHCTGLCGTQSRCIKPYYTVLPCSVACQTNKFCAHWITLSAGPSASREETTPSCQIPFQGLNTSDRWPTPHLPSTSPHCHAWGWAAADQPNTRNRHNHRGSPKPNHSLTRCSMGSNTHTCPCAHCHSSSFPPAHVLQQGPTVAWCMHVCWLTNDSHS
jgi:hypothetical protein